MSQPGEFGFGTTRGVHEIVRGTAVHGVPWLCHTQRSSNDFTFVESPAKRLVPSVHEGGRRGLSTAAPLSFPPCKIHCQYLALSKLAYAKSFVHCALLTPPGGLKCLDEHASPQDRARRTADVETLERLGRFKLNTTHSKAEVSG